jgi:GDP-L-fucose synthase
MIKQNDPIVITGSRGLVGSAVVERLRNGLYTCVIPHTREDCDLRDPTSTAEWFKRVKPYHVFHAAACVYGLGGNMANQGKSILENTLINTNVIEACHAAGSVRKLTVMGTNAIYPENASSPWNELDIFSGRPHAGEAGYGHAKRHMLAMLEAYEQSYGMNFTYIVSGNIYGPRDRFDAETGHVIPSLIRKFADRKRTGEGVVIWGDGSPERDFLHSEDLARVVQLLMSEDIRSGPINIGYGATYSIRDVVDTLTYISGINPDRIYFDRTKPNGRLNCRLDLRRIQGLGFTPEINLTTGLRSTWDWYTAKA